MRLRTSEARHKEYLLRKYRHPERIKELSANEYKRNKEKHIARAKRYFELHRGKMLAGAKQYREKNKARIIEKGRERYAAWRAQVFQHYSSGIVMCACCGEREMKFLSVDHIYGDGAAHRKSGDGNNLYAWLVRNHFPQGFQILCMNCNFAKGKNGNVCPHKMVGQLLLF